MSECSLCNLVREDAVVEPVDQAAAEVPGAANLLAASDFMQHLLNDMHAPMVTVILEEQTLAPACVLARIPYLGLVQSCGCRRETGVPQAQVDPVYDKVRH